MGTGRQQGGQSGGYAAGGRQQKRPNLLGKQFESNGPEGRVRGTAVQLYERYKGASRETQASDRVLSEVYGQFAEHYYRLAAEYGAFDQPEPQRREGADGDESGRGHEPGSEDDARTGDQPAAGDDAQDSEEDTPPPFLGEDINVADLDVDMNSEAFAGQPAIVRERVIRQTVMSGDQYSPAEPVARSQPRPEQPRQEQSRQEQPRVEQARMEKEPAAEKEPARDRSAADLEQPRRRGRPRKEAGADEAPTGFTASSTPGFLKSASRSDDSRAPVQVEVVRRRRARPDEAAAELPLAPAASESVTPAAQAAEIPADAQVDVQAEAPAEAPRRRGRPRKTPVPTEGEN